MRSKVKKESQESLEALENTINLKNPFDQLPIELVLNVFQLLSPLEALTAARVCKDWREIITLPPTSSLTWKAIYANWFGSPIQKDIGSYKDLCTQLIGQIKDQYSLDDYLSSQNPDQIGSLICWAARRGHIAMIRNLLHKYPDAEMKSIVNKWYHQKETSKEASALFLASQENYLDICKILINYAHPDGAAPDDGSTPLLIAAQNGHFEVARFLLDHKANPNHKAEVSPLYIAAQNGHLGVASLLISCGADVESKHERGGATPLFICSQNGHLDLVKLLVERGASPTNARNDGITPYMIAVRAKQLNVVNYLTTEPAQRA